MKRKNKGLIDNHGMEDGNIDDKVRNKALEKLRDVTASTRDATAEFTNLSSAIITGLDPAKTGLPNIDPDKTGSIINDASMMQLGGKTPRGYNIDEVISEKISEAAASSLLNVPSGTYKKIIECRKNKFMGYRLPILEISNNLFVDDVNNGSYRGSNLDLTTRYNIYNHRQLITDANKIKNIINIINPSSVDSLQSSLKSHLDIDQEGDRVANKNGYSVTHLVSHKNACKELYIKYILKRKKQQRGNGVKSKIRTESVQYIDVLDWHKSLSAENISKMESFDLGLIVTPGIEVSEDFIKTGERYYIEENNEKVYISNYAKRELELEESFEDFAYRYLSGEIDKVYSVPFAFSKKKDDKTFRYSLPLGQNFTFTNNELSPEDGMALWNEMFSSNNHRVYSGIESVEMAMEDVDKRVPDDLLSILDEVAFEDIYQLSSQSIASQSGFGVGTEAIEYSINSSVGRNKLEDLFIRIMRSETIGRNDSISMEDVATESYILNNYDVALEDSSVRFDPFDTVSSSIPDFVKKQNQNEIEDRIAAKKKQDSQLERMFGYIKGETSEILDNAKLIPIMGGDMYMGGYYTVYSHYDVQHLIAARSIVMNPMAFSQNMDLLDIDQAEYEETLGRLLFSDTIKPLIARNIDTKFIKNNYEIAYTLKKLMEENEISHQQMYQDITRFNMYSMSKVIFIPASSCIFKRNGNSGLGVSKFSQASVPANARILCDESFLTHYLFDMKGMSLISIPKGTQGDKNEYGTTSVIQQFKNFAVQRSDLLDMGAYDFQLTHKVVILAKDEKAQPVDIQSLQFPDFEIDFQLMERWEQTATFIIGYSSGLFMSNSGQTGELSRKLYELDNTKMLEILAAQRNKIIPSSKLATALLRLRGGSKYDSYTIEWIPPDIDRGNRVVSTEKVAEYASYLEGVSNLIFNVYEGNSDLEAPSVKQNIKLEILKRLNVNDKTLSDIETIFNKAVTTAKTEVAANVKERDDEGNITDTFTDTTPIEG